MSLRARMLDDVLIIMPAWNEAEVIGKTLAELRQYASRVLVVDDGSTDGTGEVARAEGAQVLRLAANLNYGAALQAGFRFALRFTDFPYLATFDADGQHDPSFLERLTEPLREGRADYVLGSRYLDPKSAATPFSRRAGSRLFSWWLRLILGERFTDPTSGFAAMTREVAAVFLLDFFPHDYPDADMLIMLHRMKFRIMEIPVTMRPAARGRSMHQGIIRPLFYLAKMSVSMAHLALRPDLEQKRKEAALAS